MPARTAKGTKTLCKDELLPLDKPILKEFESYRLVSGLSSTLLKMEDLLYYMKIFTRF